MFKTNVGGSDRVARIVVGLVLVLAALFTSVGGAYHWVLWIGVIPLATGLLGTCPLYSILGLSTCPMKR